MLSDEVRQNLAQLKTGIKGCVAISYVMDRGNIFLKFRLAGIKMTACTVSH
jgi:hypothetical protein